MAKKSVQVKSFVNVDKIEKGQYAQFIGEDGMLHWTEQPVTTFQTWQDGRVSVETEGQVYDNYDREQQRLKDNAVWEAHFTPEDKARGEQQERLYQKMAQNKAIVQTPEEMHAHCASHICDALEKGQMNVGGLQFDIQNALICRNGATTWDYMPKNLSPADLEPGTYIFLRDAQYTDAYNLDNPVVTDMQLQIQGGEMCKNGQMWLDVGTHILTTGDLNQLIGAWNQEFNDRAERAQDHTQDMGFSQAD